MISRTERDTLGFVQVPIDKYWGAQTERSRNNFRIGLEGSMPIEIIHALAILKKAAAHANFSLGFLSRKKRDLITSVCEEIIEGKLDDQFPLVIWQTGSGTHSNMNVNEVISNRSHVLTGGILGKKTVLHPNDDVNMSQSSNDVYSTAMHIASYKKLIEKTIPSLKELRNTLEKKTKSFNNVIKIGRTHLMDATPITLGQEFSGYVSQVDHGLNSIKKTLDHLSELSIGGTAVGTGINTPKGYDLKVTEYICEYTGLPFQVAKNKFESIASHDAIVESHGSLKQIAVSLIKIANDIRFLSSGPRSGIGEIHIPENEPGSSIMPGKINPTQCEALIMVCTQVIGNDLSISIAGSSGNYELNVSKPLMAYNFLQSAHLLSDASYSFSNLCVKGITPNYPRIKELLDRSLMLVTALNTRIGYEKSAKIARLAYENNSTLKEEAIRLGYLTIEEFDELVKPDKMV
ncbi:MAG: class II fumarate hydratase [Flavobacteriales bacterium]|jgi:fumarate hydratase class II|uniref:class II fumarate hydratase n=1 Tax=Blattabacterium sp. (Mastotermes darwiniensis) TaxID=39768 RepID=UPI000231DE04|nr:class II fumarate hydratase [Blattabacterium sp. (Mastotermes darwiniensis)]AER40568.1 fumarate hydratase [Blattabacterium sp. (Mastotermes darwiniensis) str. MADAR]MDR1805065.1 class II fumarate hydratase [Flavobacteriales bacterium]